MDVLSFGDPSDDALADEDGDLAAHEETFTAVVSDALDALLALRAPEPFLEHLRREAAPRLAEIFGGDDERTSRLAAASLGRELWNGLPLAELGIAPTRLATPGRNDPCPCGSGTKLKRCCRTLPPPLGLEGEALTYHLTRALPLAELRQWVAASAVAPEVIAAIAEIHAGRGDEARVVALCEPLVRDRARLAPAVARVLEMLLDAYTELGRFEDELEWIEAVAEHQPAPVAAVARAKLIEFLLDEGDVETAQDQLARLAATDPDALEIPYLGVVMRLLLDDEEGARTLAAEVCAARAAENHRHGDAADEPEDEPTAWFAAIAEDPIWAALEIGAGMPPMWVEDLRGAVELLELRRPVAYAVADAGDGRGRLVPPDEVAEGEATWLEFVPRTEDDAAGDGDAAWHPPALWDDEERVEAWLCAITEHPETLDSLAVLADLVYGIDQIASRTPAPQRLAVRLAERARRIVRDAMAAAGVERLDPDDPATAPAFAILEVRARALRDLGRDAEADAAEREIADLAGDVETP